METNNKSNLPLIIIFAIILVFIFFMPNIIKLFDKDPTSVTPDETSKKTHVYTPVEDNQIYNFTNDLVINYDGIAIKNFDLSNGLSFDLVNNKSNSLTNNDHYFIELYDNDETSLERLYLAIDKNIAPTTKKNYLFGSKSFNKIKVVKKSTSDYPFVDKVKNDNNEYVLTCTGKDTYTYTFDSDMKLTTIKYTFTQNKTDGLNYMEDAITYKNKAIDLDTINGVDATYQEGLNNFDFLVIYNLSSITNNEVFSNKIYPLDTELRVVSFEMNSQEYTCE